MTNTTQMQHAASMHETRAHPERGTAVDAEAQGRARALVEAYYKAFNDADWPRFLGLLTEDVVHEVNNAARETGAGAFAAFIERMNRSYSERVRDVEVLVNAHGNRVAAEYVVDGLYKATDTGLPEARGQNYSIAGGAFFELREGRIARVTNYYNLERWLEMVR